MTAGPLRPVPVRVTADPVGEHAHLESHHIRLDLRRAVFLRPVGGQCDGPVAGLVRTDRLKAGKVGTSADHGDSFVFGSTSYDPTLHTGQLRYERFDEDGNAIGGGVRRNFDDSSRHGLAVGRFYSADNPNDDGQADYLVINRANNRQSEVRVMHTDIDPLVSTTIQLAGPAGQAASAMDEYGYLRPGLTDAERFGALTETDRHVDAAGETHEEAAIQTIDPQTLRVQASTTFEIVNGTRTGIDPDHLSNGDSLAVHNDGGQAYAKESDASLHRVGATVVRPHDDNGFDAVNSLGNDRIGIDWRSTSGTPDPGLTVKPTAILQARGPGRAARPSRRCVASRHLLALGVEALEIGRDVVDVALLGQAGKGHLGTGHLGLGILNVVLEGGFVPDPAGLLHRFGIVVVRDGGGVAPDQAVELGADGVVSALADLVAGLALGEDLLAESRVPA